LFFVSNTPATSIRRRFGDHPKSSVAAAETMPWVHMYGASGRELYRINPNVQVLISLYFEISVISDSKAFSHTLNLGFCALGQLHPR